MGCDYNKSGFRHQAIVRWIDLDQIVPQVFRCEATFAKEHARDATRLLEPAHSVSKNPRAGTIAGGFRDCHVRVANAGRPRLVGLSALNVISLLNKSACNSGLKSVGGISFNVAPVGDGVRAGACTAQ